ncbi:MAG: SPOR domain-containing protein [Bacteroidales bacterium]|nr:SPOR domain-containing protein [Bacteroidales bacterium]
MELREHINEILLHRDFIIIPDLGGFVCKYQPAKISYDKTSIEPPAKEIVFKDNLIIDDNDELNKYIQKAEKVSKGKASEIIKEFVSSIKQQLTNGEEAEIPGIGKLYANEKKKIQFRKELKSNLLLDAFGMSKVKVKPIEKESVDIRSTTVIPREGTKTTNTKSSNTNDMGTKKNKSLGWIIASVIIAAGIALILIPQYTPYLQDLKIDFAGIKQKLFNKEKVAEIDSSEISKELNGQADKRDALYYEEDKSQKINGDNIPESLISNYTQYSKFYIIAGSYRQRRNADRLKSKLTAEGYEPNILIDTKNKLYRVSYKSFTDRRTAIKELYKLQKELNNEDIWILNI